MSVDFTIDLGWKIVEIRRIIDNESVNILCILYCKVVKKIC